jgi:hypothetical protein
MLLLSRLYYFSSQKFYECLSSIADDPEFTSGVTFNQQRRRGVGIPDGMISQDSFRVIIETKRRGKDVSQQQMNRHAEGFTGEQYQLLLSISPTKPDDGTIRRIADSVNKTNEKVVYIPITFVEVVEKVRNVLEERDYEFREILNDYEDYCRTEGLITDIEDRMRIKAAKQSMTENIECGVVYDLEERGYSSHSFIGLYGNKSVQAVGKLIVTVVANLRQDGILEIVEPESGVTEEIQERIKSVIQRARDSKGWDISHGHRFFVVEEFVHTDYKKTTMFPLRKSKYIHLETDLKIDPTISIEEIADALRSKNW